MKGEAPLLTVELRHEADVVLARQRVRDVAEVLGFSNQDQVRLATAASEMCRNAWNYAGGGRLELSLRGDPPTALVTRIVDQGRGIENLDAILGGTYQSQTGMGVGIIGTRRMMSEFDIQTGPSGTTVTLAKEVPPSAGTRTVADWSARISKELAARKPPDQLHAVREQNRELLLVLQTLKAREAELEDANRQLEDTNRELEDTNRGVVALYAELDARAEFARKASDVKSRFLSHLSHEFRTPLGSVLALSDMLLARLDGPLTAEQEHQLMLIRKSVTTLSDLVEGLLDIARVESGREQVRAHAFSVADLFNALRGMVKPLQRTEAVAIVFDASPMADLHTDEGKLSQILRNLVSNALKFTEKGEIRISARDGEGDQVVFEVSDTGIGIARQHLPHVFEEFMQIENKLQRKYKGTGLGLSLSKKLAELLGGTLSVASEEGKGSSFTVTLPRNFEASRSKSPITSREASEGAFPSGHGRRLLVVDDHDAPRYLVCTRLRAAGYEVEEATSGDEALKRVRQRAPDGVVLDLVMPDVNGYEVLERLKADPKTADIPVLIYTATVLLPEDRARLQKAAAIVAKPDATKTGFMIDMGEALLTAGLASKRENNGGG